jgi:alpha-tubulin suppressor-like RCC1 family protein
MFDWKYDQQHIVASTCLGPQDCTKDDFCYIWSLLIAQILSNYQVSPNQLINEMRELSQEGLQKLIERFINSLYEILVKNDWARVYEKINLNEAKLCYHLNDQIINTCSSLIYYQPNISSNNLMGRVTDEFHNFAQGCEKQVLSKDENIVNLPSTISPTLESISPELIFQILKSTPDLPDLLVSCTTSTALQSVCNSDSFWREKFKYDFGDSEIPEEGETWRDLYYRNWNIGRLPPFSVGDDYAGIIDNFGKLYMFGSNEFGRLGLNEPRNINSSGIVKFGGENKRVVQVSCSLSMTGAITEDGAVWTWGYNYGGSLGIGLQESNEIRGPVEVSLLTQPSIKIRSGRANMIALTQSNEVYVWGILSDNLRSSIPIKLKLPEPAIDVAAGYKSFAAIGKSGQLYFWGNNRSYLFLSPNWNNDARGEFNPRNEAHREFMNPIRVKTEELVRQISMGENHFGLITRKGKVWMAGNNSWYQIGREKASSEEIEKYQQLGVPLLDDIIPNLRLISLPEPVYYLDCRWNTTLAKGSKVWVWGDNKNGQITAESYQIQGQSVKSILRNVSSKFETPQEIGIFDLVTGRKQVIKYILVGPKFSVALTEDGYINMWGESMIIKLLNVSNFKI